MKKVVLSGYYGFQNSGDDAILEAIVDEFNKSEESYELTVLSNAPLRTMKRYNVNSVNRFSFNEVKSELKSCDLFVSGGGTLLQDGTSSKSLWYYLGLLFLAKKYNKKTVVYASGLGPINRYINKVLTKIVLRKVDVITFRDNDSYKFFKKLKIEHKNVKITADPVFGLCGDVIMGKRYLEQIGFMDGKPIIMVSIRPWKDDELIIEEVSKFIKEINNKKDAHVLFIPMKYDEDIEITKNIAKKLDCNYNILDKGIDLKVLIGILSYADYLVSMRLHALIYGALNNRNLIGISYDPKIDGIMKDLQLSCYIDYKDVSSEKLIEYIEVIDNLDNNVLLHYRKSIEKLKKESTKTLKIVEEMGK